MNPKEIKRFNVYVTYEPQYKDADIYRLEALNGDKWEPITHCENELEYKNLVLVAEKITELCPNEDSYKRVISKDRPEDKTDGNLEGILLRRTGCRLIRGLTAEEMKELVKALDIAYLKKE